MTQNLKPAHHVLPVLVGDTCTGLKATEQHINAGGLRRNNGDFVSVTELQHMRDIQIALLHGYLRLLQEIPIPENDLQAVIDTLEKLDYQHASIIVAAGTLIERQKRISGSGSEPSSVIEVGTERSSPAFAAAQPWDSNTNAPRQ